jgi:phosphoribosylanthranilate isomerase
MDRTKIKICGITNKIEIDFLNQCLPDYAGFVFAKSRRQVTPEQASELGSRLSFAIRKAGVFVDEDAEQVAAVAGKAGLDVVQLHGNENKAYIERLRPLLRADMEIWKALRIDENHMPLPEVLDQMDIDRLLLDTYVPGSKGGTGKCFDWSLAARLGGRLPIVLAGGLNPENVGKAIQQVSPYAVDTSSGVESEGMKSEQKLHAFMEAARGGKG